LDEEAPPEPLTTGSPKLFDDDDVIEPVAPAPPVFFGNIASKESQVDPPFATARVETPLAFPLGMIGRISPR